MLLYASDIGGFIDAAEGHYLINFMVRNYEKRTGLKVSRERRMQWKYTLRQLTEFLDGDWVNPECGIRIDLRTGTMQQRLVSVFASKDDEETERIALLELTGWEHVRLSDTDDMIIGDEGDGAGEKEEIHPAYQALGYVYFLTKGNEVPGVEFKSASYLFDCVRNETNDISTNYNPEILEHSPVFYAGEEPELYEYLRPVLKGGNGKAELQKLKELGKAKMNGEGDMLLDEQKIVVNAIKKTLNANEKGWYLIESMNGSGKSVIAGLARMDAARTGALLTVLDTEDFSPEALSDEGCTICFYRPNTNPALLDKARETAAEKGITVHLFSLSNLVGLADDGSGIDFLSRYLQLDDKKSYWDPEVYKITITASPEEFPDSLNYSCVIIPKEIAYDPETGLVSGSTEMKQKVLNRVAEGTQGTYLYVEDTNLRDYLKRKVDGAERKYEWLKNFCENLGSDSDKLTEAQASLLSNTKLRDKYAEYISSCIGEDNWQKLTEESQTWLISGLLAYSDMEAFDQLLDFSGVCVQLCKAVEKEMGLRHMESFMDFEEEKYGDEVFKKAPYELLAKDRDGHYKQEFTDPSRYTLGNSRYLIGLNPDGSVKNSYAWKEFDDYAGKKLLKKPENAQNTLSKHVGFILDVKDRFRNQAAHSNHMDIAQARDCIEYLIGKYNRLGMMLDDYIF